MIDVLIIHYNTPELTSAAIQSLWKHTPGAKVTVFDNSDRRPFPAELFPDVRYIDNTWGQVVDWDLWLQQFPHRQYDSGNEWGSAKHCYSVELCMDLFPSGFVLMDSDILMKCDISDIADPRYAWVGAVHCNTRRFGTIVFRLAPFLCYINTGASHSYGIRYFNPVKMWKLVSESPNQYYDTGAWFLEACNKAHLQGRRIDLNTYLVHFGHGSWKDKSPARWLDEHRDLWNT